MIHKMPTKGGVHLTAKSYSQHYLYTMVKVKHAKRLFKQSDFYSYILKKM